VAHGLEARFKAALAVFELSPRQFSVLAVLVERPEVTVAEIARAVLTTPQSMAALTEGLEARPWGLRDFRLLDPDGYYWRITERAAREQRG